jgi:hypothetical protein
MSPVEAVAWLEGNMIPFYRLGEIKDELGSPATIGGER